MENTSPRPDARWPLPAVVGLAVLAVFQVVGSFGASRGQPDRTSMDALAVALALAGPASLIWLRRRPMAVLWTVIAITLVYLLRGYPYGPVVFSAVIAVLYTVMIGRRVAAWSAVLVLVGTHFTLGDRIQGEDWSWGQIFGVTAWALLILIVGEFARVRRDRAAAARAARDEAAKRQANEERLRIARELHDTVAHHMSLINVQAGVALHLLDRKPEQAETALTAIRDASKEGLAELRSLLDLLRDEEQRAPRSPTAMLGSLDDIVERTHAAGLSVTKRVEGVRRPLPTAVELAAFRIVQEAITNIVRHSGAGAAQIVLGYGEQDLTVQIDDDGRGGPVEPDGTGSGIRGMRERATTLHGTLQIEPSHLGGLRVLARIPTKESP